MEGMLLNIFTKSDYKDKNTGETFPGDNIMQIQQQKVLANGEMQMEYLDIPVDNALIGKYAEKKVGDMVQVPCNVYGENFAQIKISKAK